MTLKEIFYALALFLVFEGILPFAFPRVWLMSLSRFMTMPLSRVRAFGLGMMLLGVVVSVIAHHA